MTEEERQRRLHDALQAAMRDVELLDDGELLTGWIIAFEKRSDAGSVWGGEQHGPESLPGWHALGLMDWAALCIQEAAREQ